MTLVIKSELEPLDELMSKLPSPNLDSKYLACFVLVGSADKEISYWSSSSTAGNTILPLKAPLLITSLYNPDLAT